MSLSNTIQIWFMLFVLYFTSAPAYAQSNKDTQPDPTVFNTTTGEPNPKTPEISTEELKSLLAEGRALLLDARPHMEWAISHIPGAINVAPKPGVTLSLYTSDVAEVERVTDENKAQVIILYCNGPYCGKSKRLAEDLINAGYTEIKRYQLGAPVWRALGGVMEIEPDGIRHILENDKTAVFIDARDPEEFQLNTLPGSINIPRSKILPGKDVGEIKAAKDDGRLPMADHNTRIIIFGHDGNQALEAAEALTREAFHNVSYFNGELNQLQQSIR